MPINILLLQIMKFTITYLSLQVKCSGPGIESGIPASLPVEFLIDAKDAGNGILAVQITVFILNFVEFLSFILHSMK